MNTPLSLQVLPRKGDPGIRGNAREWLVTNGLGGYASGDIEGASTRRYHGLFIPNLPAPRGRTVLLPQCVEDLVFGEARHALQGPDFMVSFRLEWRMPVWEFSCAGRTIQKRLLMPHGQNSVYVEYRLLDGENALLHVTPYPALRGHDGSFESGGTPYQVLAENDRFKAIPPDDVFALKIGIVRDGLFSKSPSTNRFYYPMEKIRGMENEETLSSPGFFTCSLERGIPVVLFASIEPHGDAEVSFDQIAGVEEQRVRRLIASAPAALQQGPAAQLVAAADQFIVVPETRALENLKFETAGDHVRSVIAGYHWFTDWGRDTMISLEGLCLCTNRHDEAKAILRTFANYVRNGLLPNHFPEGANEAIYNTVDATLWYFHALDRYLHYARDPETLELLFPLLKSILDHHIRGTDYGIGMDESDALLRADAEGFALTWMDAQYDGWVVTPRRGKPVEIQALWYNALRLLSAWAERLDPPSAHRYRTLADRAHESFNRKFWNAESGCLYDVVEGPGGNDAHLRPNQIFALSLRHPVLHSDHAPSVLKTVYRHLLTPMGLRTLSPQDPEYRAHYEGNRRNRDGAYHQGLVWPWMAGHFFDAWQNVFDDAVPMKGFLKRMETHLSDAGIGSISEIFDAEEPYIPGGCIAQAWSVAETLRLFYRA